MRSVLPCFGLLAVLWGGCPRDLAVPDVPREAQPCDTRQDCNTAACGQLRACVDGFCEPTDAGSLAVPCP
jgi:hypothetical protein